eukprot:ANDGO_00535.mRNA.1 Putative phosphatidylinositol N-acetylglucosaminyltransferase subunit C
MSTTPPPIITNTAEWTPEERLPVFTRPAWKKVLWEHQPYEDDYVGDTFLKGIIKNAHVLTYDYWNVVRDSAVLAQQLSTVCIFSVLFVYTMWGDLPVTVLCGVNGMMFVVGFAIRSLIQDPEHSLSASNGPLSQMLRSLWESVLLVLLLMGVSPIIRSLTLSYANDTIWAWTISLFVIHIIAQDYSYLNGKTAKQQSAFSLNAAVFATVLLVSRLESSMHAFAILCLSFEFFGLSPILRHDLKLFSNQTHFAVTFLLYIMSVCLMFPLSRPVAIIFFFGMPAIVFGSPAWLIAIQKYKNEIVGPWDEAVPSNVSMPGE